MRTRLLSLSVISLVAVACSAAPDERSSQSQDPLMQFGGGTIGAQQWWMNPPPAAIGHVSGVFAFTPNNECPDLSDYDGVLRGMKGTDWMASWGQNDPRIFFSDLFTMVAQENSYTLTFMMRMG